MTWDFQFLKIPQNPAAQLRPVRTVFQIVAEYSFEIAAK